MPEEKTRRTVAYKARICDIIEGKYVKEEGEWTPNHIETKDGKKISRVNIIGVLIAEQKGNGFNSIVIGDKTGQISGRIFENYPENINSLNIGDIILIIGRPREFNEEKYIQIEIIKKIEDKRWIKIRDVELNKKNDLIDNENILQEQNLKENKNSVQEKEELEKDISDKILDYVRKNDQGDGVDFEDIIKDICKEDDVKNLLSEGELFEIRPGRLKVLE